MLKSNKGVTNDIAVGVVVAVVVTGSAIVAVSGVVAVGGIIAVDVEAVGVIVAFSIVLAVGICSRRCHFSRLQWRRTHHRRGSRQWN